MQIGQRRPELLPDIAKLGITGKRSVFPGVMELDPVLHLVVVIIIQPDDLAGPKRLVRRRQSGLRRLGQAQTRSQNQTQHSRRR